MNSLNQLIIEGKCTGEKNEYNMSIRFMIATLRDGETTEFPIFAYGSLARMANEKIKNGQKVRLVGRLTRNKWTDENGKKQAGISIVAEHIDFMEVK